MNKVHRKPESCGAIMQSMISVHREACYCNGVNSTDKQQKRTNVRKDIYIEHTFVYNKRNDGGERNGVKTWSVDTGKTADLADAAKYDVACTSSGVDRKGKKGSLGNSKACGICHSFSADGRCISLLKVLMTNHCVYDCKYCANRYRMIRNAPHYTERIV